MSDLLFLLVRRSDRMNELKIHGIYKHFKGDYYLVEGVVTHSETFLNYKTLKA